MLVLWRRGHCPTPTPDARYFASQWNIGLKKFHQNAKYLASGVGVGQCTRRQIFALPNAKYTNMLVYFALADAILFALPDAKPLTPNLDLH